MLKKYVLIALVVFPLRLVGSDTLSAKINSIDFPNVLEYLMQETPVGPDHAAQQCLFCCALLSWMHQKPWGQPGTQANLSKSIDKLYKDDQKDLCVIRKYKAQLQRLELWKEQNPTQFYFNNEPTCLPNGFSPPFTPNIAATIHSQLRTQFDDRSSHLFSSFIVCANEHHQESISSLPKEKRPDAHNTYRSKCSEYLHKHHDALKTRDKIIILIEGAFWMIDNAYP